MTEPIKVNELPRPPDGFQWDNESSFPLIRKDSGKYSVRVSDGAIIVVDGKRLHGVSASVSLALLDANGLNTTAHELREKMGAVVEQLESGLDLAASEEACATTEKYEARMGGRNEAFCEAINAIKKALGES